MLADTLGFSTVVPRFHHTIAIQGQTMIEIEKSRKIQLYVDVVAPCEVL